MAFTTFLLAAEVYFIDVHDLKDNASSAFIVYRRRL